VECEPRVSANAAQPIPSTVPPDSQNSEDEEEVCSLLFRARICKSFMEPRNRFSAWRAGTTTLLDVPARRAALTGGIASSESIPGLHKRLKIRPQYSEHL